MLVELAEMVKKVFVPSIASDLLSTTTKSSPDKFYVARKSGTLGTEEVLVLVDDYVNSFVLG